MGHLKFSFFTIDHSRPSVDFFLSSDHFHRCIRKKKRVQAIVFFPDRGNFYLGFGEWLSPEEEKDRTTIYRRFLHDIVV